MADSRGFAGYQRLMQQRVQDILLVASPYDSFILEEDGQLAERILSEYVELHLSASPRFTTVSSAQEAHTHLRRAQPDLVITTPHCLDMPPSELARSIKSRYPSMPVVMLAYDRITAQSYAALGPEAGFQEVFLWTGDPRLLLVIVKSVEDRRNVAHDTQVGDVRVILVVEDSPTFYSSYLPIIYTEVLVQTKSCMSVTLTEAERVYRSRARPKILMARTYEGGQALIDRYRDHLQGVVMDMTFPRKGRSDRYAGKGLIEALRERLPDMPILLQSAESEHEGLADTLGVAFADKNSPDLLAKLRHFMSHHLGFGPFVFREPDGSPVGQAADIEEMTRVLPSVPDTSLLFHAARNHLSSWLMTRCEFDLAAVVREVHPETFENPAAARMKLVGILSEFLDRRQRGKVTMYTPGSEISRRDFTCIGTGSMGGKARGIAFCASQLACHPIHARHPGVRIFVPRAQVICTDIFDRFIARDNLRERAINTDTDEEIVQLFLSYELEDTLLEALTSIVSGVRYPLAVRSSSLFEDSTFEPLAGLYKTVVVPNSDPSLAVRLDQLSRAVRLVFSSTFFRGPRAYMEAGTRRLEEEKMAVVVQRLVGSRHEDRFYPDFSGVAQSHNFYPIRYLRPEDGVANVALGLGQAVVEGHKSLRFSPAHPEVIPQLSSTDSALRFSQRAFFALDLSEQQMRIESDADTVGVKSFDLSVAEADGTLGPVGATYCPNDDRIHDTIHRPGHRLVTFAQVLKYDRFPLAKILRDLMALGEEGLGSAAELEFAVALDGVQGRPEIALLQLRPLVAQPLGEEVEVTRANEDETVILMGPALGSGLIREIRDVVYVHPAQFSPDQTHQIARDLEKINARLSEARRTYLLAGPGRWGTADARLGVPVTWPQVSQARVLVELATQDFRVDPSQGTHFFHTITSLRIGYFTIDLTREPGFFNVDLLDSLDAETQAGPVRHVRLPKELEVRIDARRAEGLAVMVPPRYSSTRRMLNREQG